MEQLPCEAPAIKGGREEDRKQGKEGRNEGREGMKGGKQTSLAKAWKILYHPLKCTASWRFLIHINILYFGYFLQSKTHFTTHNQCFSSTYLSAQTSNPNTHTPVCFLPLPQLTAYFRTCPSNPLNNVLKMWKD